MSVFSDYSNINRSVHIDENRAVFPVTLFKIALRLGQLSSIHHSLTMSALRRFVRGAVQLSKSGAAPVHRIAQRSMSTILESREKGEETKFIRAMEADRQAAIRANIDRILALEDSDEDKADLMEILGKCPVSWVRLQWRAHWLTLFAL
jgi:hypothetical protein